MQPPPFFTQPTLALNPLAAGLVNRFAPTADEDEEFRMTVGNIDNGKKRAFGIFQDAPEVSPGRTESPLEEPRYAKPLHCFYCSGCSL